MSATANTQLIEAAKKGDVAGIQAALKSGADIEFIDESSHEKRALHWAAQEGHIAAVKALVKAGAEVDAMNRFDRNPLYLAAWFGHFEVAYWIWRRGGSKYSLDKWGEQAAFAYGTPKEIAHWLNKEREARDEDPDPVFPGLVSSDEEK